MVKNLPGVQETWVLSLDWEDPLEEGMATPPPLLGEPHGQTRLAGCGPWGRRELDLAEAAEHSAAQRRLFAAQ